MGTCRARAWPRPGMSWLRTERVSWCRGNVLKARKKEKERGSTEAPPEDGKSSALAGRRLRWHAKYNVEGIVTARVTAVPVCEFAPEYRSSCS